VEDQSYDFQLGKEISAERNQQEGRTITSQTVQQ
jgi:hypothetical protein